MPLSVLSLRVPRESENSPEQTAQLLASLSKATKLVSSFAKIMGKKEAFISLEVTVLNSQITFCVLCPQELTAFVQSQLLATYPDVTVEPIADYLADWQLPVHVTFVRQTAPAYFPLRDYADYKQVDPMLPLLGILAKAKPDDKILIQFILSPAPKAVAAQATRYITPRFEETPEGKSIRELPAEEKLIVKDKLSHPLVGVSVHMATSRKEIIADLLGAISVLNRPDGNSLAGAKLKSWDYPKLWTAMLARRPFKPFGNAPVTLNVMELSSLWHLPGVQTKLPNIGWAASVAASEAPDDLPVATSENSDVNIFAETTFKNDKTKFGIKLADRLRHMYVLGKSGTGKSTLLENMAVDDFKKGQGVAFIDPHGDSIDNLLNYIPSSRINDTIYFNPADREHPISLNILESSGPDEAEFVVSGIIAIFHKLYGKFWGPRMQYIFRNALLTLVELPDSTLPDIIRVLGDIEFRKTIYPKLKNKALLLFWQKEFDVLEDKVRLEYTYPILNKVGQFVNSPLIQGIISHPRSSIDIAEIMDSGKIFLANLSQGKLGEDNATLLGAMLITKFELAAMRRIDKKAEDRKDFFLYVDEFQNFATESFIKILSEARKFHLGLILANQYVSQIPEEIQKALFGNVGTLACFNLGADDAEAIAGEFAPVFDETSLVNLQKHQIALKMNIDGQMSRPFSAFTLPPLKSTNQNKDKVLLESQKRWAAK